MTVHFGAQTVVTAQTPGSMLSSIEMREDVATTLYWLVSEHPGDTVVITNAANAEAVAAVTDATVISYPDFPSSQNQAVVPERKRMREMCELGEKGKVFAVMLTGEDKKKVETDRSDRNVRNVFEQAVLGVQDGQTEVIEALQ